MQNLLFNFYQYGIRIDGISFLYTNGSYGTCNFGHDFGFHLHSFQNNNNLTNGNSIAFLNSYIKNGAGHRADYGSCPTRSSGGCRRRSRSRGLRSRNRL